MYIITDKNTNGIMGFGNVISYRNDGYPVLEDKRITFVKNQVDVYEVDAFESPVDETNVTVYCYTPTDGFYKNLDCMTPEEKLIQSVEYQAGYDAAVLAMIEAGLL